MTTTWDRISKEMNKPEDIDIVRRKYLKDLSDYTKRNTIIYVADFLEPDRIKSNGISVEWSDKAGFQEVIENLDGSCLDILIESPGGSPEAAQSIVNLLRGKFNDIRFIVPNVAKSAATMLALSGDMILMDQKSELGPTDPQFVFKRDGTTVIAPAQAILDQFNKATKEIQNDSSVLPAWIPILTHYGPSLLQECENARELTERLVSSWLEKYMFAGESDNKEKADRIAKVFADNKTHLSHKRMISIEDAKELGIKVFDMREDQVLQKRVWELYQSINLTFDKTGAFKIFENHKGTAFIQMAQQIPIPLQIPTRPPQAIPPQQGPMLNRQQRRHPKR